METRLQAREQQERLTLKGGIVFFGTLLLVVAALFCFFYYWFSEVPPGVTQPDTGLEERTVSPGSPSMPVHQSPPK